MLYLFCIRKNIAFATCHFFFSMAQDEKKKKDDPKKEFKKEVKVELVDMISSVKSRQLMSMQAKREREEMDKQNKGDPRFP